MLKYQDARTVIKILSRKILNAASGKGSLLGECMVCFLPELHVSYRN